MDLGGAPGSWSQFVSKNLKNTKILTIDTKRIKPIDDVFILEGNFTETKLQKQIKDYFKTKIDVLLSDMAENTTGNKNLDSILTGELCKKSMYFAKDTLDKNGIFVSKFFMGSSFNEIISESKLIFKETKIYKPPSSRKDSKEIFIINKLLR